MYYVYLLRCKDKSLYTGITTDVERRFKEHRDGTGGHYTRSHKPEKIMYREKAATRSDALKREAEIKSWPREKKMKLVRRSSRAVSQRD
jgi:putative endonuclease